MLIGLNGFKQSGKSTVAAYLTEKYHFEELAFANSLKDSVAALFDITRTDVERYKDMGADVTLAGKIIPFRTFLQRFGTEMARDTWDQDFWVDRILPNTLPQRWHADKLVVISDVRFHNELRRIRQFGGYTIRIERSGIDSDKHGSEIKPNANYIDYTINNDGTLTGLYAQAEAIIEKIIRIENA